MKVVTIGSGVGGLLTSAFLAKNGHDVLVLERAPFIGGRCTNISYRGFGLSTGAFHMIPHGADGPLAHLLRLIGADVEIVNSSPKGLIRYGGRTFHYREGWKYLGWREKARAMKLMADVKRGKLPPEGVSAREWIEESVGHNEFVLRFIESFLGWAVSLTGDEVPAVELAREIKATLRWGGPGLIRGGCKALTGAIAERVEAYGGKILTGKRVVEVDVEKKSVITAENDEFPYDVLISNAGLRETVELIGREHFDGAYLRKLDSLRPSEGIKYNIALPGKPRIGNTVVFTLDTERINGYNEPSSISPELAPEGYTLVMAHHALRGRNVRKERELGLREVEELFPEGEVLMVQTYLDGNPVNRVASGQHLELPLEDVFVVGDAYKGEGGIEIDGIALGVMKVLQRLNVAKFDEWYL